MSDKVPDQKRLLCSLFLTARRPLLHALIRPGLASAFGIELDKVKCDKADAFLSQTISEMQRRQQIAAGFVLPLIQCAAIEEVLLCVHHHCVLVLRLACHSYCCPTVELSTCSRAHPMCRQPAGSC